jgi:hypothetical protein
MTMTEGDKGKSGVREVLESLGSTHIETPPEIPPPPHNSLNIPPPPLFTGPSTSSNTAPKPLRKVAAPPPKAVTYKTAEEERTALNQALERAGLNFRATSDEDLQAAKKAAGLGSTKALSTDFKAFEKRLIDALKLGALNGVDTDEVAQQDFADSFKAAIIREVPERKKRLENEPFTFEQCLEIAGATTEEAIFGLTPSALARRAKDHIGDGALSGIFPGESLEATSAQGGQARLDKMIDLGNHIIELLHGVGDVHPELTGSIVLSGSGYSGIPEDLDINITTKGSDEERQEQWEKVLDVMNNFDGLRVATPEGSMFIFAMKAGKVQGENSRIWERRFGYPMKFPGEDKNRVMPFEIEVKDVGGEEWKEHLLPGGPARKTDKNGASKGEWLLLDTMTRIIGHRNNMIESAQTPNGDMLVGVPEQDQPERWITMVQDEGLDKSHEKRLWEKLNVAFKMAETQSGMDDTDLEIFLKNTVKDPAAYGELLHLAQNEQGYEAWLQDIV